MDELMRAWERFQEMKAFNDLKKSDDVGIPVLILHPKYKDIIAGLRVDGVKVAVLWSDYVEEDKIYQVLDPFLRKQIIDMNKNL